MSARAGGRNREGGRSRLLPVFISLLTIAPNGVVTQAAAQRISAPRVLPASMGTGAAGAAAARPLPVPLTSSTLGLSPLSASVPAPPVLPAPAAAVVAAPISARPATAAAPAESPEAAAARSEELFDGTSALARRRETSALPTASEPTGNAPARLTLAPKTSRVGKGFVHFDWRLLLRSPQILRECYTKPNKQDYVYLATKTFGLNLAVRVGFAAAAMMKGDLTLLRAALSTGWYQGQDALFTVFGQTYMKFVGRMTGLLRIGPAKVGDLAFIYLQLCAFEFLNRLVLGPIGMNPLVYTWGGLGLIFLNVMQGMLSGGPLVPVINKMRAAGIISESVSMHLYQLASLTMLFGLAASFGHQHLYMVLTVATMIVSWGAYGFFTFFYKSPKAPEVKR